jgi:hypothetical protein
MQRGKRQLHLGLVARGTHHATIRRLSGEVIEQRGLADARFARHHQCPTLAGTNRGHEPV